MPATVIDRRQCACGCGIWFNVTNRAPRQFCLNRSHGAVYSAKQSGRREATIERRREGFSELIASIVTPGQPVKHAHLVDVCERAWKLGYFAGHRVGKGAPGRRAKRVARTAA